MSQVFSFQEHSVRTITENGQPWFAGSDIAKLLGYVRPEKEVRRICKHVKLFKPTNLGGWGNSPRGFLIIPEADVWRLIMRSTLDKAQEIEEWIMGEVLPAIRKTGRYEAKPKALSKPKQKALPASEASLAEKGVATMERLLHLRADVFRASVDVRMMLASPFSKGPHNNETPEHQRQFANALNEATSGFFMAINNNLIAVEQMFKAYVEAERMLHR